MSFRDAFFKMDGVPFIVGSILIKSFKNRDNALTEIGSKRWIYWAVQEVEEALLPLTHYHSATGDFEEGLYELLTHINKAKPDPIYPLEEQIYDLSHGLFNRLIWEMDISNDDPADYPGPEDSHSDAEEARGGCFMWHYAPVA